MRHPLLGKLSPRPTDHALPSDNHPLPVQTWLQSQGSMLLPEVNLNITQNSHTIPEIHAIARQGGYGDLHRADDMFTICQP